MHWKSGHSNQQSALSCSSCTSLEGTASQNIAVTLIHWLSSCFEGCKSRLDIKNQTIYSAGKNVFTWLKNVDLWNSFSMITKYMFFVRTWWWCAIFSGCSASRYCMFWISDLLTMPLEWFSPNMSLWYPEDGFYLNNSGLDQFSSNQRF